MHVNQLLLIQDGFRRSTKTVQAMIRFVAEGGKYDADTLAARPSGRAKLMVINRFEDGRFCVHDGLHRAASIFLGRPSGLLTESEYEIQEFTYDQYNEINLEAKYFTPFDPRTEVRVADLSSFKNRINRLTNSNVDPTGFILENKSLYAHARESHHESIGELINQYRPELLE